MGGICYLEGGREKAMREQKVSMDVKVEVSIDVQIEGRERVEEGER